MLNFAIIGLGGLGKSHLRNAIELQKSRGDIKLVALCDIEQGRFTEEIVTNIGTMTAPVDLSGYNLYNNYIQMFDSEKLDFVITALPTYIHEKAAVDALGRGIHVFSEKPMARTIKQCENMLSASKDSGKLLMIGQCLRYAPEHVKLKEYIDTGIFGKVVRAQFSRYSLTPIWTWQNWMMDYEKSGGAALDMHIHDVDFINYAFGKPNSVVSNATHFVTKFDSILTTYDYPGMLITSAADWGMTQSYPFEPAFIARFEKATVKSANGEFILYPESGEAQKVELGQSNPYVNEVVDFINCIKEGEQSKVNPPQSTLQTMQIAMAEVESAEKGERVYI